MLEAATSPYQSSALLDPRPGFLGPENDEYIYIIYKLPVSGILSQHYSSVAVRLTARFLLTET